MEYFFVVLEDGTLTGPNRFYTVVKKGEEFVYTSSSYSNYEDAAVVGEKVANFHNNRRRIAV